MLRKAMLPSIIFLGAFIILGTFLVVLQWLPSASTASTTTTTTTQPLTTSTTSSEESTSLEDTLLLIFQLGLDSGAVEGTYEEWLESIQGPQGDDGREIVMQVNGLVVEWKYDDEEAFQVLIDFTDMMPEQPESLYELYMKYHPDFQGDEEEWLDFILETNNEGIHPDFFTWTFDLNGGVFVHEEPLTITMEYGESMQLPTPIREGFVFLGWFQQDDPYAIPYYHQEAAYEDRTLIARWDPEVLLNTEEMEDGTIRIIGYYKNNPFATKLIIPSSIDGKVVTVIGERAFEGSLFEEVMIPSTIVMIEMNAFMENLLLTSLTFEEDSSLKVIGYGAFYMTPIKELFLPASVTTIESYAFNLANIETLVIPEDSMLETIGYNAFEAGLFLDEDSLLLFPASLTSIGDRAFKSVQIGNVEFMGGGEALNIGVYGFQFATITSITLPTYLQKVGSQAFSYSSIVTIVFETGDTPTFIDEYAFYHATIQSCTLPTNLEAITRYMFAYATIYETLTIPDDVTAIGDYAFLYSQIVYVILTENSNLQSIGNNAFNATLLENLYIPSGVTTMGGSVFMGNPQLTITMSQTSAPLTWNTYWMSSFLGTVIWNNEEE